jgi:selenocysteine lyase/cysteine desulfurase
MVAFLDSAGGNPGRGGHRLTVESSRRIEGARQQIATLLGGDPERTLVGPGCTFWLNTLLRALLRPGDRVVTSALEHNAVMRPLRALAEERQLDVEAITGGGGHGVPTADEVAAAVATAPTSLVILTHASNVTGAVLPVAEIAAAIRPVPVVVDGAQTAGCVPFDFAHSGLAAWTCSGHKGLLGPPGTGLLLVAPSLDLEPLVLGGTGSNSESEEMPAWLPDRLEAGTPNGPGIVGLGAACRWLADRGVQTVADHEHELVEHLVAGLAAVAGVTVVGRDHAPPRDSPRSRPRRDAAGRPPLRSGRPSPPRHLSRGYAPSLGRPVDHSCRDRRPHHRSLRRLSRRELVRRRTRRQPWLTAGEMSWWCSARSNG